MAELHIERKERSAWPWLLLGALLVALLLWFVFGMADDDAEVGVAEATAAGALADPVAPVATAEPTDATMPAAVTEFTQYVQTSSTASDANLAHDYTSEGLRRLAAALGAVTERETVSGVVNVSERVAEIRTRAERMQADPTSTAHALQAREASLLAAALMRELSSTDGNAASSAREAYATAEQIDPDVMLLDQIETVRRFFDHSATAIRGLAAAP